MDNGELKASPRVFKGRDRGNRGDRDSPYSARAEYHVIVAGLTRADSIAAVERAGRRGGRGRGRGGGRRDREPLKTAEELDDDMDAYWGKTGEKNGKTEEVGEEGPPAAADDEEAKVAEQE